MSDLENRARELGIKIDARWGDERLQQEIDKHLKETPQGVVAPEIPMAADAAPPKVVDVTPGPSPVSVPETVKPKGGEKQIDIKLKVDYWPVEDQRKEAGSVVKIPLSKAKELIAQGKAEPALSNFGDDD
ncbi:hypothetical protein DEM27_05710 [Metarhizobium album]|uniref:Uncharacterized protein n=1 Tax=Metarhizobium album TaxID=2182425 RepID=A0A2U2DV12_9HYPH|nr:hypothetical protein [Rhizobium album]PWE57136.1 hypothetical protein DEM27_05710 [Rhizobium album]